MDFPLKIDVNSVISIYLRWNHSINWLMIFQLNSLTKFHEFVLFSTGWGLRTSLT